MLGRKDPRAKTKKKATWLLNVNGAPKKSESKVRTKSKDSWRGKQKGGLAETRGAIGNRFKVSVKEGKEYDYKTGSYIQGNDDR